MFTALPHKHHKNTNDGATCDILIAFSEGSGHHHNLYLESLQKVRDGAVGGEFHTSSSEWSHRSLASFLRRVPEPPLLFTLSFLRFIFLLHHGSMRIAHIIEIFFKVLIYGGQSLFTMLNLRHFRVSGIKLHAQLGIGLFPGNPRFCQVQCLKKQNIRIVKQKI
jgi:hypothetical protein